MVEGVGEVLGPMTFEPRVIEKVWGGDRLRRYGLPVAAGDRVGEAWLVADLGSTSASGAGGGAERSVVADGPLRGYGLDEVVRAHGDAVLGASRGLAARFGGFPMLVKFLDAREHLSVQVHPSPSYAAAHAEAHLKTECWVVLEAEAGARGEEPTIFKGLKPGVGERELRAALAAGRAADVLHAEAAVVGECHLLPSGTVHALGAGVLVAEVQTPSDTTFRLYDWVREYGRPDRAMHVEEGLAAAVWEDAPEATRMPTGAGRARLVTTEFFELDGVRGAGTLATGDAARVGASVVVCVGGAGVLRWARGEVGLRTGAAVLVPAGCAGEVVGEGCVWLEARGGVG